jgi:hypothetical protein
MLYSPPSTLKSVCLDYDMKSVIFACFLISNVWKLIMPHLKQKVLQLSSIVKLYL